MFNFGDNQFTNLLFKCLIVAGGFAVGYVFAMLAAIGFDKLVAHRQSPAGLHKTVRMLGGLLVAILVAILVFRQGGSGGGDGSGDGPGTKPGQTSGTGTSGSEGHTKPSEQAKPESRVTVEAVRVKVLAGDEVEKGTLKFYQLADKAERVDRGAVIAAVTDRKKAGKGSVVVVYEFGKEAGAKTIGFTDLESDAKQLGVQLMSASEFEQFVKK